MVYTDQRDGTFIFGAAFLITAGTGLMLLALAGLAAPLIELWLGWRIEPAQYFMIFLLGVSLPPIACGVIVFRRTMDKVGVDLAQRRAEINPPAPPALPPPVDERVEVLRVIGGTVDGQPREPITMVETRPRRWVKWQAFGRVMHEWAALTSGEIHTDALVGDGLAFGKDRARWVIGTNGLAVAGLAVKRGNSRTTLACSLAEWRARLDSGKLEWPTDFDPPRIYPPRADVIEGLSAPA